MDIINIKEKIKALVDKYEEVKKSGKIKSYTEEETKKDFILPLFEVLGWNVYNKREVSAEEFQKSGGRVDYGFYLDGRVKFYLEAKSFSADLNREEFAKQAIKYSWNKGVTWAILTDFENIKVFNAQYLSSNLGDKLFFEISYDKYIERFDQLELLSKEFFEKNLLDFEGEKYGKKLATVSVNKSLINDLNECREILTHNLAQWNPTVHKDLLDEGVQKLLDRLIFIRVAEDRGVEPETLTPLVREWESSGRKTPLYRSMISKFRELDKIYNSNLFSEHPFETWDEDGTATKKVINILYGKLGYYEYDFKLIPADVLGSVYENYLGYKLSQSRKNLTISKDAKKRKDFHEYAVDSAEDLQSGKFKTRTHSSRYETIKDLGLKISSGATGFQAKLLTNYLSENQNNNEMIPFVVSGSIDPYNVSLNNVRYMGCNYKYAFIGNGDGIAKSKWNFWLQDKIVISGMTKKIEAYYSNKPLALGVGIYAIHEFAGLNPYFLLAILNSTFLTFYFREEFRHKHLAGGYLAINKSTIEQLPIVKPDAELEKYLAELAKKMISLIDQYKSSENNSNEWERLKEEIEKTNKKIDEEVYKLYNLTSEEIKIVEASK